MVAPAPPPPPARRSGVPLWITLAAALGLALGLLIGLFAARGTGDAAHVVAQPATGDGGRLEVVSTPAGGAVLVDGRMVGLTPIARLDLDPGAHAVVIDLYGYEPYLGTVTMPPHGRAGLEVILGARGNDGATTHATWRGDGRAVGQKVPPSSLAPAAPAPPAAPPPTKAAAPAKTHRKHHARAPEPPARDCYGEERDCKSACGSAATDCDFSCPTCASCTTNWDECNRQCASCRQGCKQNRGFCEAGCERQRLACTSR